MRITEFYNRANNALNIAEKTFIINVFLPVVGETGLNYLEPQTPFIDNEGRRRRIDFTLETSYRKYAIEIDGYTDQAEGIISREQFDDGLLRQKDLMIAGYTVLRFSYNQITQAPERCHAQLRRALVADEEPNPLFNLGSVTPNIPQQSGSRHREMSRIVGHKKGLGVLAGGLGKSYFRLSIQDVCEASGGKLSVGLTMSKS